MTTTALLLALMHCLTFRSPVQMEFDGDHMVRPVFERVGLDGTCVVFMESRFRPRAENHREKDGTSYGLFQLYSLFHPQFREDVGKHIEYGAGFWNQCMEKALGNYTLAVRLYNSGSRLGGVAWADRVRAKRDDLAMYLWRRMR